MYKVKSLDEFINESFFKNLSVGEYARIEAQLVEWSKQRYFGNPRIKPGSWTINNDLTVDINGNVWLSKLDFEKLPVKFGKVTSYFSVYKCKNLTTLDGCPEEVGSNFICSENPKLTSLEGAPKKVGTNFLANSCGKKFTEAEVKKYSKVKGNIHV